MSIPQRNAEPNRITSTSRTFFVTTNESMNRSLLQSDRNADLLVDVLRSCVKAKRFRLHDFVIMPNHLHALLTIEAGESVERAMQFIKGNFSFRLKKEPGYLGEVWQRGFSEIRIDEKEGFRRYRDYIAQNPVKAGLAPSSEEFPWCMESLSRRKAAGAKAQSSSKNNGTTEVVP
jgi:putative transposase